MPDFFYEIPIWLAGTGTVLLFVVVALTGMIYARRWLYVRFMCNDDSNQVVGGVVQAIGVFYGITVGLIAVSAWTNYDNVASLASHEAAAIGALYRDVSSYPEPKRSILQAELRDYTDYVIDIAWPAQRRGETVQGSTLILNAFQRELVSFEPTTEGEKILHAEALRAFNHLVEQRRLRIDSVGTALPAVMWAIVWAGAAISIVVMYFFYLPDHRMHGTLVGLTAAFVGILIVVIAVNDRPYSGQLAVGPESYQLIVDTLMNELD
jgi:hypothetical protein